MIRIWPAWLLGPGVRVVYRPPREPIWGFFFVFFLGAPPPPPPKTPPPGCASILRFHFSDFLGIAFREIGSLVGSLARLKYSNLRTARLFAIVRIISSPRRETPSDCHPGPDRCGSFGVWASGVLNQCNCRTDKIQLRPTFNVFGSVGALRRAARRWASNHDTQRVLQFEVPGSSLSPAQRSDSSGPRMPPS